MSTLSANTCSSQNKQNLKSKTTSGFEPYHVTTVGNHLCYGVTVSSSSRESNVAAEMIPVEMVEAIAWSEKLGRKLKKIREEKQLSRNKLVRKIVATGFEISPQYIQKLEIGFKSQDGQVRLAQSVSTNTLQAILKALNCPLHQFLDLS